MDDHFRNLQPGTIVNGRYEVVKSLGAGSMGMVYACRDRELGGRLVAMKVLFSEVAADKIATQRFKNEIFASYTVNHPNVVRAYEYFADKDLIAYTMEYVGGGDLAERISGEELIPIPEVVRMLSQMCCGVQAIHQEGIIHRDLKPENILLTSQADIKITDFGIARLGNGPKLTDHGGVVGTIDYVSPEYLEIGQVDARSDIYALGVLGYEMITSKPPFSGQSVIETMTMRLRSDPCPPYEMRDDCPERLSDIIMHAMKRAPEERYQSAAEMVKDLDDIAHLIRHSGGDWQNASGRANSHQNSASPGPSLASRLPSPQAAGRPLSSPSETNINVSFRQQSMPGGTGAGSSQISRYAGSMAGGISQTAGSSSYSAQRIIPPGNSVGGGLGGAASADITQRNSNKGALGGETSAKTGRGRSSYDDAFVLDGPSGKTLEEDRFELFSSVVAESQIDLGRMSRAQQVPFTMRGSNLVVSDSRNDDSEMEEFEQGFLSQLLFWFFVIVIGLTLGCMLMYFYNSPGKLGLSNWLPKSIPLPSISSSKPDE